MTWTREKIKELRLKLGLSQAEFAETLGCRQQTVSEWELGIYAPANAYGRLLNSISSRTLINRAPIPHVSPKSRVTSAAEVENPKAPASPITNTKSNGTEIQPSFTAVFENEFDKGFDPGID